jgi:hypothetical protein
VQRLRQGTIGEPAAARRLERAGTGDGGGREQQSDAQRRGAAQRAAQQPQ